MQKNNTNNNRRVRFAATAAVGLLAFTGTAAEIQWNVATTPGYQQITTKSGAAKGEDQAFRTGISLGLQQVKEKGFLLGGSVETYFTVGGLEGTSGAGTGAATSYTWGINPEMEARYRHPFDSYRIDAVAGIGLDYFTMSAGNSFVTLNIGDVTTTYVKVGMELQAKGDSGFLVGGALVYPLSADIFGVSADAKPGFDAELGYRFSKEFASSVVFEGRYYEKAADTFSRNFVGLKLDWKF